MTAITILVLLGCVFGLLLHANHLRKGRDDLKQKLDAERSASRKLLEEESRRDDLEKYGEFVKKLPKAETVPSPEPDSFLEIADLRRQLAQSEEDKEVLSSELSMAQNHFLTERRSNAALRGQITKLTPKEKGK